MPIILQADTKKKGGREVGGERKRNKFKGEERIKKQGKQTKQQIKT